MRQGIYFAGYALSQCAQVTKDVLVCVIPLAAIHALGNVLTNLSLSAVAVSFTHTIKARSLDEDMAPSMS